MSDAATSPETPTEPASKSPKLTTRKKAGKSKKPRKKSAKMSKSAAGKRVQRPYPASSFEDALPLAEAIHEHAKGERIRRLTLLKLMEKSPTSGSTRQMITNSTRYGLTSGSFAAEWLELTELGHVATNPVEAPKSKLEARITLAVQNIAPFNFLYDEYKGKRLPTHEVLKDILAEGAFQIDNVNECIDFLL